MRAFVTGATGFLGGRLVEKLRGRGAHEASGRGSDEVVCLETPEDFMAVGQFYRSFPQVEDEDVVALLAGHGKRKATHDG